MIKELKDKIIKNLSDDLLKKEYINLPNKNRYTGHCYIASETYYHLSNENLKVYHITVSYTHLTLPTIYSV